MLPHSMEKEVLLQTLAADPIQGLRSDQVQSKLAQYGPNKLRERKKKTNLQRFAAQFKDVMILILIVAAIISFVVACYEGEPKEFFEPALILLIVILNAVMGVLQESKAEKALEALKSLRTPCQGHSRRTGADYRCGKPGSGRYNPFGGRGLHPRGCAPSA